MFKDDDEEEENTFGVTRYPCMPSLVALQQMRTRLHLAFLGRKLMKWTALATGREMRRLASELYNAYQGFGEDMRDAFIMLARCRYFVPQLNSIVTENISKKAGVIVQQSTKAVSGVKIVQFEVFETDSPPYAHLGIEKGGQAILEAKKAWLDLLKRLLMMMQLRESFLMVELANKNATKKWNVLSKLVVPRLNLTCRYIISELEEIEREDNFRLKRFKELKIKKTKGKEDKSIIAETCECIHDLETKEQSIELIDHTIITSPIENSSTQCKDKEENKTCPKCKDDVKQEELNIYEENNCPTCKNNEIPNVKSKELIIQEQISKDDNLCPSCKKKSLNFIDPRDTLFETEQSSLPNNVCASCKYFKSENENYANEFKKAELIDQRDKEKKSTKYCPACKPPAIKNNTFGCGNIPDIDLSENDELEKDLSETCSLCEKMGTFGLHHSSCRFKSNITKKQTHQTCTDDMSENVEIINEIVKFKRIQNTDGNVREEIKVTTRRTQKYVLPGSPDTDKYIKETIDEPEKSIKQTKFENKNKCEMNGILQVPNNISSQNSNSSQYNTTCNRVPENGKNCTTKKSSSNFMICKNTKITESNGFLTKSLQTSNCSQDITKVKSDNNSCCKIKIKSKDEHLKDNSDVEEIELTPSTIVILKKILSYTNKSNVSCKFIETDKNQSQTSNTGCKAKTSSDNNSIKSEPCMRKEIQESFNKKRNKTEPICTTCNLKDVSKSQEDIPKQDRTLPCSSRSDGNLKPEQLKLDPSIKPCLPPNIKSQPETNNKMSSCKQEKRQTIEQKTEHTRTGTKICQESDKTKESTHYQKITKNASKSSCETKACQTRQQHQNHESKEKSRRNKNNKTNSKESCCACKEKHEDEVQKKCTCSKTKPPHTPKAKPKSSKIVIKLFEGSCSCKKPIFNSVHLSSSKQSNQSDGCTGTAEILSKANQTCLMDRLSDDDSYKSSCLCLKNSNLDIKTESEKKLSSSKSKITMKKDGSDPCTCKKNSSANSSVVEKKCSDVNKSVSRECSCVSEKTKKLAENYYCACRQAKNIRKSKETEIKKECQCQINAHSKPGISSFEQLKSRNSCKIKQEPKFSCICSSKQSIHRRENKDTVSSISQICTKCLSRDQDLKSKNEECYCTKHEPKQNGHYDTNHGECSCSSIKRDLSDTVSSSRSCNCQKEKTTSLSNKQECSKINDVKKLHGCTCKKANESKQSCLCSKSDTSKHSETSGINSKTCKGAEAQSSKSNKGHSGECSCRSSKNKIESYSEKSLVKTNGLCRKCNSHKANEEQRDTETCQVCREKSNPCSCKETKPNMNKTCRSESPASPNCPCESSKQSPSIASSQGTEFMSVDSQTCSRCASIQTSQKSIRFSHDASPTRIIKSDSSVPTGSSCSLKSGLLSQSSQLSSGKKDVSTSTKRSDRYDVRTLRHLAMEPKKLDCRCQSDSALLKIKNPKSNNPIGKCCSLHDSKYFRC